jgi:two-component system nitrogen regulation sensor histidine kinase NtrY
MENKGNINISTHYDTDLKIVSCNIADDGPGVSAEMRHRLFEPYFSTKKGGTGLGLAIATSIVADHNGFIRFKDNTPSGACFVVELPA